MTSRQRIGATSVLLVLLAACDGATTPTTSPAGTGADLSKGAGPPADNVHVFATGLDNPRGLTFGPKGDLYVAEGGRGGTLSTAGQCTQVIPPVGPYTGGFTGRISKISRSGVRSTVAEHLPSSQTSPLLGSLVSGVASLAFIDHTMYALLAGAGCSHGVAAVPNGIIRIHRDGSWSPVADLSAFQQAHPVAHSEEEDFEPDGTWYTMIAVRGDLYAVEPNHGELDRITPRGRISRVVDISAAENGHIVPTALAYHGNFYVANLGTFPIMNGTQKIMKITPSGRVQDRITGLTSVLGLAFDERERLYALEMTVCPTATPCDPTPGMGRVVRVSRNGALETIASGLTFPTGMAFGPDDRLYVSTNGLGFPPGAGQIVRIDVKK